MEGLLEVEAPPAPSPSSRRRMRRPSRSEAAAIGLPAAGRLSASHPEPLPTRMRRFLAHQRRRGRGYSNRRRGSGAPPSPKDPSPFPNMGRAGDGCVSELGEGLGGGDTRNGDPRTGGQLGRAAVRGHCAQERMHPFAANHLTTSHQEMSTYGQGRKLRSSQRRSSGCRLGTSDRWAWLAMSYGHWLSAERGKHRPKLNGNLSIMR